MIINLLFITCKQLISISFENFYILNKSWVFSFVSRCSHVWCRSRRFNCILLVSFKRRRLAVCSRNITIYITRDYIVRQTKKTWLLLLFTTMNNHNLFLRHSASSLSKKSISHEHWNITDILVGYQQQLFPLFHNITFSSYIFFLVTFERIRKF